MITNVVIFLAFFNFEFLLLEFANSKFGNPMANSEIKNRFSLSSRNKKSSR